MTDPKVMKMLFCCDGSRQSERAVLFGVQIAAANRAESSILGIAEEADDLENLLKALRRVQVIFKANNLDVGIISKIGKPEHEIIKFTETNHYDLVVIGATRKKALWRIFDPSWMSVRVYNIIESIEPSVLVVVGSRPEIRRILLCTSGSEFTEKTVKFAGSIARSVEATVDLIHVMPQMPAIYADLVHFEGDADGLLASHSKLGTALNQQKELLEQLGVFGEMRLRYGDVVSELLRELKRTEYDLVVSGSFPAQGKLRKYVLGDVAREIVNHAQLPVLVIRTGKRTQIWRVFKKTLRRLFRGSDTKSVVSTDRIGDL